MASSEASVSSSFSFSILWSRSLATAPAGLSLARERGWTLAWDQSDWLYLLDHDGNSNAQRRLPGLSAACCADDASAYAAAGKDGKVWWLAPDLMARWEKNLHHSVAAVALDPHGQYLAVSDSRGHVYLFDRTGQKISKVQTPRPLQFLSFVPEAACFVGSADFGLVTAIDLNGETVWRDGLVVNVGGLSLDSAARQVLVACYSHGLQRYSKEGKNLGRLPTSAACRLVSQSYMGDRILIGGISNQLLLLNAKGEELAVFQLEHPAADLILGALGHDAFVAVEKGPILKLSIQREKH